MSDNGNTCGYKFGFVVIFILCIILILAAGSLILVIMTIKVMTNTTRYLYRYIIFCISLVICSILKVPYNLVNDEIDYILLIFIFCIYMFLTTWRLLEITVLNEYFNSLNSNSEYERITSYSPVHQSHF